MKLLSAERISDVDRGAIAGQVRLWLEASNLVRISPQDEVEVEETLELWTLDLDSIACEDQSCRSLSKLAQPSGRLHHQIKIAGQPNVYARSIIDDKGDRVREVAVSELASSLDRAIARAEKALRGHCAVRLLLVPDIALHALWIVSRDNHSDKVIIVESSSKKPSLKPMARLPASAFLTTLANEQPIQGYIHTASAA